MGVPVALATFAACGSIVTSIKSSWELRRMIKRKQESKECDEEAPYIFRRLRRAYYDGLMGTAEYEQWYEKFLVAKVEKDCEFHPSPCGPPVILTGVVQCQPCAESART
jgi:ribosome assembly protein 4